MSTAVERQICLGKKNTAVDDRVHVDDGGVERPNGLSTLVLAKPNVPTVGEGCERSVGWCVDGGGRRRRDMLTYLIKLLVALFW